MIRYVPFGQLLTRQQCRSPHIGLQTAKVKVNVRFGQQINLTKI